ncbi:unnamed protein product [Microthlaspi erraticum]|uniref:Uncharacterized protein n=1 Tax=Microthlaspi erraticum TaxID=1685480 RepID=A0A6D2HP93_9BRAS|nr:unnamed protein product [Microthlaspi erraticum]
MGRSTLWDWKKKTWDLIQRSQRRLGSRQDQERSSRSEDTARLSRWDDHCANMGRVDRTTKYQSSPNQEEKSLDDIRDHSEEVWSKQNANRTSRLRDGTNAQDLSRNDCKKRKCSGWRYSELMAKEGPEVMIGDGPEGDRSNRMAKQARRNRALSKRKQSA